mmetsp:Transcript_42109/g.65721  ORF Transcript_42109/g.65721 Transcript_42109/m.65721 type:complete len:203 (-) Transcript_42109:83-691(-)
MMFCSVKGLATSSILSTNLSISTGVPSSTSLFKSFSTANRLRGATRQTFAVFKALSLSLRKTEMSCSLICRPSPFLAICSNNCFNSILCAARSSSSDAILNSSLCCRVVLIMLSLTTAVNIDNNVQELVTMKKMKPNLTDGNAAMSSSRATASSSDSAPLITRKRINILSGTVLNTAAPSGDFPGGNSKPWPSKRVDNIPAA